MNIDDLLMILLGEFYEKIASLKDLVTREASFPNAPNKIKVAIGMRRTGKTYFLYENILQALEKGAPKSTILYLNFEDNRLMPLDQKKFADLVEAFYRLYPENHERKTTLYFDEVQNVEGWSAVVRRLQDSKNCEIFLTGSSAKLLSKEIASSLRGRSLATEIWPYSFPEYLVAKNIQIKEKGFYDKKTLDTLFNSFQHYLSTGGFPEVVNYEWDVRQRTLQEYIDVVVFRDIVERHKLSNTSIIKNLIFSMLTNIARPFSINKCYNDFKSRGFSLGKDLLYEYCDFIEDAFMIFSIPLFDSSIRKIHSNPKKIYAIDPGLVRASTLDYERDLSKLFENLIFLDLRRQGYRVSYYLTKERFEVDFVAQDLQGKKKFFQVALNVDDTATYQREIRALETAQKEQNIPGEIVTLDSYLKKGVRI